MQKEKRLAPRLRFPEFEGQWEVKRLEKLFSEFKSGQNITASQINETGKYPVFGGNGLRGYFNEYTHEGNYFLIGRQGALCGNINRFNGRAYFSEHAIACIANESNDTTWLSHRLEYLNLNRLSESSAQPGLSVGKLLRLKLTVPTFKEQQKIADFLTTIDTRLQSLENKKSLLEQYKKGVMQQIFKQEIRFKDEDGRDFPEWEFKKGNLLFKSVSDKNHNSDLPILAVTQDQGAIPRDQINYNIGVTEKSVGSYKVVQIGDFIISLRSFQGGIEYSRYKGICSPAYIILRPIKKMNKDFYKYYLKTPSYIGELVKKLEGIRDGKMVSYKYFSEIKLPYPSIEEQNKIADFLSAIDKKIALLGDQIEKTKTYKKGLLQQMFV